MGNHNGGEVLSQGIFGNRPFDGPPGPGQVGKLKSDGQWSRHGINHESNFGITQKGVTRELGGN